MAFKLTGDRALDAKFQTLPGAVQKRILRDGLRPAAKIIRDAMDRTMKKRSGRSAKNLKVRAGKRSRKRPNGVRFIIVSDASTFGGGEFYVPFAVLGHRAGSRRLGNKRKQVPGTRTMQRALKLSAEPAKAEALARIKAGIEREARGTGR